MGDRPCLSMCKGESALSESESSWRVGGRLPHGRVLWVPLPLPCAISHPVSLNSQLVQGLPHFRGFGVQGAAFPLACARSLQTLLLFIRAVGREFFFSLEPPLFFTLPTPHASASYRCAIIEAWVEHRGLSTPGSQRQWAGETLPPFHTPSSSLIKTCL